MDTTVTRPEGGQLGKLEIDAILKCLPHRYPFLMIDKIVDIDGDESAVGIKNVTVNEPILTNASSVDEIGMDTVPSRLIPTVATMLVFLSVKLS